MTEYKRKVSLIEKGRVVKKRVSIMADNERHADYLALIMSKQAEQVSKKRKQPVS